MTRPELLKQNRELRAALREFLKLAESDAWHGSFRLDDALETARELVAQPAPK